jgi:hypothetical protein
MSKRRTSGTDSVQHDTKRHKKKASEGTSRTGLRFVTSRFKVLLAPHFMGNPLQGVYEFLDSLAFK